ncbi:MAG TPA: YgiQ family radical SAM protein, partial [Gammaproteobacteria bacterium]|nr:YgiQ family radical SAM protein [Gammaproteobacteria bacterium]
GIEASLRRIAQYDHWSQTIRRSILPDSKADLLLFGNAERAVVEVAHRVAAGEDIKQITDIRGTAYMRQGIPEGWTVLDSSEIDADKSLVHPQTDPYADTSAKDKQGCGDKNNQTKPSKIDPNQGAVQV